jgi:putative two-component system response regulator
MRKRIMVIDDNLTSLTQVKAILSRDHDVLPVTSGAQALKLLDRFKPELILLDIVMPDMDGFATLSAIRASGAQCEVMVLTGAEEEEGLREKCLDAGAKGYLRKPLTANMLMAVVDSGDGGISIDDEPEFEVF